MEGNFKHQNAYSGYDEVYSIIENFKERVQYIADFPCYDDDSDIKYEDAIEMAKQYREQQKEKRRKKTTK